MSHPGGETNMDATAGDTFVIASLAICNTDTGKIALLMEVEGQELTGVPLGQAEANTLLNALLGAMAAKGWLQ